MRSFLLCTAFLFSLSASAQDLCGTDEFHSHKMNTDLEYRENYNRIQSDMQNIIDNGLAERSGEEEHYVIPVVVHVIHLGEAVGTGSNISEEQIQGALDGLNERFANMIGNGLDIQMSFCLAKRNPQGCPTNGIVRVNGISLPFYQEGGITRGGKSECSNAAHDEDVKDLSNWPVNQYYNIWVVHAICGGWAGYAYYPWGSMYDGAVMHRSYMTYSSTTLTHEIGHAFNLPHTFNGDNNGANCPLNSNCVVDGDMVCDTPPHKIGDCGSSNPCTTEGVWDNSRRNYMSYCGGTNRFTQGQKDRMRASMQVPPRANLRNSNACSPSNFSTSFAKTNVSCPGLCDGVISVEPGCVGEYTYLWNNEETGTSINQLCPGSYSVTISDAVSETSTVLEFEIFDAPVIDTTTIINNIGVLAFCEGGSVTLSSTIQGTYAWSNGATSSSIVVDETGTYSVTVTSALGCINNSSFIDVEVYPSPDVMLTLPDVVNYMDNPFVLNTGTPSGGEYWGPGVSEGTFYPALAGVGTHQVFYSYTDSNDCADETSETIVVEPFISVDELEGNKLFTIYPNPSEGRFQLEVTANEKVFATCYDAMGKIIFVKSFAPHGNRNVYSIEMPSSAEGIYYLNLVVNNKSFVKPILVQRSK